MVDAGLEVTYEEKMRVPPLGMNSGYLCHYISGWFSWDMFNWRHAVGAAAFFILSSQDHKLQYHLAKLWISMSLYFRLVQLGYVQLETCCRGCCFLHTLFSRS